MSNSSTMSNNKNRHTMHTGISQHLAPVHSASCEVPKAVTSYTFTDRMQCRQTPSTHSLSINLESCQGNTQQFQVCVAIQKKAAILKKNNNNKNTPVIRCSSGVIVAHFMPTLYFLMALAQSNVTVKHRLPWHGNADYCDMSTWHCQIGDCDNRQKHKYGCYMLAYGYILCYRLAYFYILCNRLAYFYILCHRLAYGYILCNRLAYFNILCHRLAYFYILCHRLAYGYILCHRLAYGHILCHRLAYGYILCHRLACGYMQSNRLG